MPYSLVLHQTLKRYECEDGEGCGVRVEAMEAKYSPHGRRRVTKPTRLLAEITTFLDYGVRLRTHESLESLRGWKWERDVKDEQEADDDGDAEEWGDKYVNEDAMDETLALLTNSLRQDGVQGDLSAFYIGWQKFHDSDSKVQSPTPPPRKSKTPPCLHAFKRMLLKSGDRTYQLSVWAMKQNIELGEFALPIIERHNVSPEYYTCPIGYALVGVLSTG